MKVSKLIESIGIIPKDIDFDVTTVSTLTDNIHNSMMFCKYKDWATRLLLDNVKECLILVPSSSLPGKFEYIEGNIIFGVDDPRYSFGELITKFNLRDIYQKVEFTDYKSILKTSKIVSKSAKIYNAIVGNGCSFHHNVLVGVDDFTPMRSPDKSTTMLLPQLGWVELGDRVEIFNNSIVSRGALYKTSIGDDTKIDSLVQVGHNCQIGKNCMITAGVIIAGSVVMGDNVFVGVGSHIRNGVKIGNNVTIAQGSNVVKDIPDNAIVMGNPAKIVGENSPEHDATDVPCN